MCGRYSIAAESSMIEEHFGAKFAEPMRPRFNAAPSQKLPVVLNRSPRTISFSAWGLKPVWLSQVSSRGGLINVRAETLREKRTFAGDLAEHRCLIPADGFYEWKALNNRKKVPYRIARKDGQVFAFAGIWQEDKSEGASGPRFAIITTAANEFMRPIHNRMPVILSADSEREWLDGGASLPQLFACLESRPSRDLTAYAVSTAVNRASADAAELIRPAA